MSKNEIKQILEKAGNDVKSEPRDKKRKTNVLVLTL